MYRRLEYLYILPMKRIIEIGPVPHPIAADFETHPPEDKYEVSRRSGRPEWTFFLVESGGFFFEVEGRQYNGKAQHFYAIEPGIPHHYGTLAPNRQVAACGWTYWWAHVFPRPTWDPWLAWPSICAGVRALPIPPGQLEGCIRLFNAVCTALTCGQREARQLAMAHFEALLITCDAFNPMGHPSTIQDDGRIAPAVEWINSHYNQKLRLDDLANICNMSRSTFCRLFRGATGLAPLQYREKKRITEACQSLRLTHATVADIAEMLGYCDIYHFSTRFKKATGLSPMAYRKDNTPARTAKNRQTKPRPTRSPPRTTAHPDLSSLLHIKRAQRAKSQLPPRRHEVT